MKTAPYYICLAAMIATARELGYPDSNCEEVADKIIKTKEMPHPIVAVNLEFAAGKAKDWVQENGLAIKADKMASDMIETCIKSN